MGLEGRRYSGTTSRLVAVKSENGEWSVVTKIGKEPRKKKQKTKKICLSARIEPSTYRT